MFTPHITTNRCMFKADIQTFLSKSTKDTLGSIVSAFHGDAQTTTITAWEREIDLLKIVLQPWQNHEAYIFFEYDIPRLGKRIDVVLLLEGIIFCLEFKVGQTSALQADVEQVLDYALDLKNFHLYSADRPIVPISIPTECEKKHWRLQHSAYHDQILNPIIVGKDGLQMVIRDVAAQYRCSVKPETWGFQWEISPYLPTPTIIEAARALYENHSVDEITRHEADKDSMDATIAFILDVIEKSKRNKAKSICFVTGVPGAGKTLVGLDVAVKQSYKDGSFSKEDGAVYLSGNGPLVAVLTEALAQDNKKKCDNRGVNTISKSNIDKKRNVCYIILSTKTGDGIDGNNIEHCRT